MTYRFSSKMHSGVMCLWDESCEGEGFASKSITNSAEAVVHHLSEFFKVDVNNTPIIYKDTEGNWDQLCVNVLGQFSHFGFLDTTDMETAIARAAKPPAKAA